MAVETVATTNIETIEMQIWDQGINRNRVLEMLEIPNKAKVLHKGEGEIVVLQCNLHVGPDVKP